MLDATFLGEYRDETMEIINRLVELNNGSFHASKDDMEILKKLHLTMIILELTITRAVLSDIMMGKMIYSIMEQEKKVLQDSA